MRFRMKILLLIISTQKSQEVNFPDSIFEKTLTGVIRRKIQRVISEETHEKEIDHLCNRRRM